MRANLLCGRGGVSQLVDEDTRHSLPISQMGNYQDYLKKQPQLESAPVRQHMFGNPFKTNKNLMMMTDEVSGLGGVDEVQIINSGGSPQMAGGGGGGPNGRGMKRAADQFLTAPPKKRKGPLPRNFQFRSPVGSPSHSPAAASEAPEIVDLVEPAAPVPVVVELYPQQLSGIPMVNGVKPIGHGGKLPPRDDDLMMIVDNYDHTNPGETKENCSAPLLPDQLAAGGGDAFSCSVVDPVVNQKNNNNTGTAIAAAAVAAAKVEIKKTTELGPVRVLKTSLEPGVGQNILSAQQQHVPSSGGQHGLTLENHKFIASAWAQQNGTQPTAAHVVGAQQRGAADDPDEDAASAASAYAAYGGDGVRDPPFLEWGFTPAENPGIIPASYCPEANDDRAAESAAQPDGTETKGGPAARTTEEAAVTDDELRSCRLRNNNVRQLIYKEVKRPGRSHVLLWKMLENLHGPSWVRQQFIQEVKEEAVR